MEDGASVSFTLSEGSGEVLFALGVRKSGSSIFANIAAALAKASGVNVVDVPGTMFERGYRFSSWNDNPHVPGLVRPGNLYVGFRDAPTGLYGHPSFVGARKILLVRDPRDALVSEYFSNAWSHSLPRVNPDGSTIATERVKAQATTIDAYVLDRVVLLDATVAAYAPLLADERLVVMRYEDVILEKAAWIRAIARHFDFGADDRLVAAILGWADVRPANEDPTRFIRRVTPGDHREKLAPATIAAIEAQLSPIWARLGYG